MVSYGIEEIVFFVTDEKLNIKYITSLFKKSTKQDKESYQHSYVIQKKSH